MNTPIHARHLAQMRQHYTMTITRVPIVLVLFLSISLARGDEADAIQAILDAKDKSLAAFVAQVVKAPPRQFREPGTPVSPSVAQWEQVGALLKEKLLVVGGTRFVIGKSFGLEELTALLHLRDWLLSAPPAYFNVCYAVIVEATVARSSLALLAEKTASASDVRKLLGIMAAKPVPPTLLLDLAIKIHPTSIKAREWAARLHGRELVDLTFVAEELGGEWHEYIHPRAKELLESPRLAGLLDMRWAATIRTTYAGFTCSYMENGGTLPTDAASLKADLEKRLPGFFNRQRNPITGEIYYAVEVADQILSALERRLHPKE